MGQRHSATKQTYRKHEKVYMLITCILQYLRHVDLFIHFSVSFCRDDCMQHGKIYKNNAYIIYIQITKYGVAYYITRQNTHMEIYTLKSQSRNLVFFLGGGVKQSLKNVMFFFLFSKTCAPRITLCPLIQLYNTDEITGYHNL